MPSFALPRILSRRSTQPDHLQKDSEHRVVTAASVAKARQLLLLANISQLSNLSPPVSLNSKSFDSRTLAMANGAARFVSDVVSSRRSSLSTSFSTAASVTSDDHIHDFTTNDSPIFQRLKAINITSFGFSSSSSSNKKDSLNQDKRNKMKNNTSTSSFRSSISSTKKNTNSILTSELTAKIQNLRNERSDLPPTSPMSSMYDPRSPSASTASASIPISDGSLSSSQSPRVSDGSASIEEVRGSAFNNLRSMFENDCANPDPQLCEGPPFIKADRPRVSQKDSDHRLHRNNLSNKYAKPQQKSTSSSHMKRSSSTRSDYYYRPKYGSNRTNSTRNSNHQFQDSLGTRGSFINSLVVSRNSSNIEKQPDRQFDASRIRSAASDRISSTDSRKHVEHFISSFESRPKSMNNFEVDPAMLRKSSSAKNLGMPRGKVEELPIPRPSTPCRLPRPRVFIAPSPSSALTTDAVAVTEQRNGEVKFVTREVPRPIREDFPGEEQEDIPTMTDDEFYEDEEDLANITRMNRREAILPGNTSEVISTKARRAVNALRSISFQAQQIDDLDTAWGQADVTDEDMRVSGSSVSPSSGSSKWRRPRVRTSQKKTTSELELRNDYDLGSLGSTESHPNVSRDRVNSDHRVYRGMSPRKNVVSSSNKPSLWNNSRNSNESQAIAAQIFASNAGSSYLAASSNASGISAFANRSNTESRELVEGKDFHAKTTNDKYVDFIHASAEREARSSKGAYKTLPGRVMTKAQSVFRRKWK